MDRVNFLKTWRRLCGTYDDCYVCPLYDVDGNCINSSDSSFSENEAFSVVEKWAAEHPAKTRKDDFLKKYPNVRHYKDGTPTIDRCAFDATYCKKADNEGMDCVECTERYWNEEI